MKKKLRSTFLLESLEARLLFSADLAPLPVDGGGSRPEVESGLEISLRPDNGGEQEADANEQLRQEIIFVDGGVDNSQQLIFDLEAQLEQGRQFDIVALDSDDDGIAQISAYLRQHQDVAAVHVISHGDDGELVLGNSRLNATTLDGYATAIEGWQQSFTNNADLLFYGCDLAAGNDGQDLVNSLTLLTGADVAASDDITGSAKFGGDWELEYSQGQIETAVATSSATQQNWNGALAIFNVTTTADGGAGSLRQAIIDANANAEADVINLPAGTYTLTGGDLVITDDVTINGADPQTTVVDGNAADRVFTIENNSTATLTGITIMNGDRNNSGGVFVDNGSTLYLSDAIVRDNTSNMGGGVHVHGTANLDRVLLYNNTADDGGAIHYHGADGGSLTNVTISGNNASNDGGGLWTDSDITLTNVTIADNSAGGDGGGLYILSGTVDMANSIVADNSAGVLGNDIEGAVSSSGYNIVKDTGGVSGLIGTDQNVDPLLGGLAANGGDLMTHAPSAVEAIDTADRTLMPTTDQRGFLRGDGSPDIGAYEASASANGTADYLDQFDTEYSYAGDDGALPWGNDWQEINESDGAGMGNAVVYIHPTYGAEPKLSIWKDQVGAWREADLSGASNAYLSFDWALYSVDAGDSVTLEISTDGGMSWNLIDTYAGPADHGSMQAASYDISAFAGENIRIKFESTTFGDNDEFLLDNVRIVLTTQPNSSPNFQNAGPFNVDEGASVGTTVGDIDADDGDGGAGDVGVTYAISANLNPDGDGNDAFAIDPNSGVITVNDADDLDHENLSSMVITVEADDGANFATTAVTIDIDDVAPALSVSGDATIKEGEVYTLNLSAVEPGSDDISSWTIDWGDGTTETIAGNPSTAAHTYTNAGFTNNILVSATDSGGTTHRVGELISTSLQNDSIYWFDASTGAVNHVEDLSAQGGNNPVDVQVGPDGEIYVTGFASNNILRYNTDGSFDTIFADAADGLNWPARMAFGPDGHLYVTNMGTDEVLCFSGVDGTSTGTAMGVFVSAGLNQPDGITFGPDGDLYVANMGTGNVLRFDGVTGAQDPTFLANGPSGPNGYMDIHFGPDGRLWVTNQFQNDIRRYSATDGAFYDIFADTGATDFAGITFGPDSYLYMADAMVEDKIIRYPVGDGSAPEPFIASNFGGLDQPVNIAFSPAHQVTVLANQAPTANPGGPYTIAEGEQLDLDGSASTDSDGTIVSWEWDIGNNGSFEKSGETVSYTWAELNAAGVIDDGTVDVTLRVTDNIGAQTTQTFQVTVDNTAPTLTVSGNLTTDDGAIYTLNLSKTDPGDDSMTWTINWGDGTVDSVAGSASIATHTYTGDGLTYNITVSASDEDGSYHDNQLLVADSVGDKIVRFAAGSDTVLGEFANNDLFSIDGAVIGPDGMLYAGSFGGGEIKRYDPSTGVRDLSFLASDSLGQVAQMAFGPDGLLYVVNSNSNQILTFDTSLPSPTASVFIDGTGSLTSPMGLLFHPDGSIYVSGYASDNVVRYGANGNNPVEVANAADGISGGQFLALGRDGAVYIASTANDRIYHYDGSAVRLFASGAGVDGPLGVTFGPDGYLYVTSELNGTAEVFRYDTSNYVSSGYTPVAAEVYIGSGLTNPRGLVFIPNHQVTVNPVNDAPTASGTYTMPGTDEDTTSAAVQVSAILSDASITAADVDGDTLGIAVFAQTGLGTWQYSTDGVGGWTAFGIVDPNAALLLSETTWVRYVPDGANGESVGCDFRAWDQSTDLSSINGTPRFGDTTPSGGTTAYSTGNASVALTVSAANDAPTASGTYTMAATDEDTTSAAVQVSAILSDASITAADVDGDTLGIAVFAQTGLGTWQYSTDGVGGWTAFGIVDPNAALLLSETTWVRYVPDGANGESVGFDFRAWDQSTDLASINGTPRFGNTTPGGGTTAYSTGNAGVALTVSAVNDPPVLGNNNLTITEGATVALDSSMLSATDVDHPDPSLTFNVSGVTAGHFAFSSDTATPITSFDQSDITAGTVVFVHDGNEASPSYSVSVTDGTDSTAAIPANITFSNQNDAPTLGNNSLTIDEGATVIFDSSMLSATDVDNPDPGLTFNISAVMGGQFERVSTGLVMTVFTQADITAGEVRFVHDGSQTAPSYNVSVTDGSASVGPTPAVINFTNINDPGTVTINNMTPAQGDTLTASVSDPDGAGGAISYQWFSDGVAIGGATSATYTTVQADVGSAITVTATYTDDLGAAESPTSAATAAVTNVNDPGSVTIDNMTPAQGDTLTANVIDPDGVSGAITYQWFSDGAAIGGATGKTYTTVQADVGTIITVTADYIDDQSTVESLISAATAAVTNVNDNPDAVNDNLNATEDNSMTITSVTDLLGNDSDIDGDALTLSGFSQPANGMLVDNADGTLGYTPAGDFCGIDSFTYTISDGNSGTADGTAIIVVAPVGDTPRVTNVSTSAEVQSGLIFIDRNASDGPEVSHFKISGITNGSLYFADGLTRIDNGDYVTVAQGQAGLRYTPAEGSTADGSFNVESSEDGVSVASQSGIATSIITVLTTTPPPAASEPSPPLAEPEPVTDEDVVEEESEASDDVADETDVSADADNIFSVKTPQSTQVPGTAKPSLGIGASFLRGADFNGNDDKTPDRSTLLSPQMLKMLFEAQNLGELKTAMGKLDITTLPPDVYELVRGSLDAVKEEMGKDILLGKTVLGSAIATSVGLSAGYVVWMLKGGSLLASVLSSLPAWQLADPLAILVGKKDDEDEDDESLKTIIEEGSGRDKDKKNKAAELDNLRKESAKR